MASLEGQVHQLVNRHRADRRLPRLRSDAVLIGMARRHSEAMASGQVPFGHAGFERRAEEAVRDLGLRGMGENVFMTRAGSSRAAWHVVGGWLESPGHRTTLEGCYTATGVGAAVSDEGTLYVTQLFGLEAEYGRRLPGCARS